MRAYSTRVVIDIDTLEILERDWIAWDGPWDECKGGNSKAEMQQANQLSQQQLALQQQQFNLQKQQLGMVNPSLNAIIQNGGMLPAQQAAMTSQALNSLPQQYSQMYGALSNTLAARGITGGENAGAGALARSFGSLGAQEAGQQSQMLENIQLAKGQNLMNALGMGLGEGQMYGQQAGTAGSQGVNALGIGQQAAKSADEASTSFWGSMIGGLAGLGGDFLKGPLGGCWVAAELYGCESPQRARILNWLIITPWITPFRWLYWRIGRRWATYIHSRGTARRATKILFDWFLKQANG